jgi:hypothetical protein
MLFSIRDKDSDKALIVDQNLVRVVMAEKMGLKLPIIQVSTLANKNILKYLKVGTILTLKWEYKKSLVEFDAEVVDLKSEDKIDTLDESDYLINATINLLVKKDVFVREVKQWSKEASISSILTDIGFEVEEIDSSIGVQNWVNPNKSRKYIARQVLTHLYLGEKNCPLSTIMITRSVVTTLEAVLNKEPYIFSLDPKEGTMLRCRLHKSLDGGSLVKSVFPANTILPVKNRLNNIVKYYNYQGKDITRGVTGSFKADGSVNLTKPLVDNGNCYDGYYKAIMRNQSAWVSLEAEAIYIELVSNSTNLVPSLRFDIEVLSLLDLRSKREDDKLIGLWVVSERHIMYEPKKGGTTILKLNRVPEEYFKKEGLS